MFDATVKIALCFTPGLRTWPLGSIHAPSWDLLLKYLKSGVITLWIGNESTLDAYIYILGGPSGRLAYHEGNETFFSILEFFFGKELNVRLNPFVGYR